MNGTVAAVSAPGEGEEPLDPAQPIVDAHHHLYHRAGHRYLLDDFLADLRGGHDVRATVYVQARAMYRGHGPEALRPLGETEFANGVAAQAASGRYGKVRIGAEIVGHADLLLGDGVRPVLEAHIRHAGGTGSQGGRFCGVRHIAAWDADATLVNPAYPTTADMLDSGPFRSGFAHLAPLGLTFDAWIYFPQILRLAALARAFPETPIVLDHCGGILGAGAYAGRRDDVFAEWSRALRELATCPNVAVKLGGLGMLQCGLRAGTASTPASSIELAALWRPWFETCIELFGTHRCMFESNFPADKSSHAYTTGWNAFQRITGGASRDDKANLFCRSATRFYGLHSPVGAE